MGSEGRDRRRGKGTQERIRTVGGKEHSCTWWWGRIKEQMKQSDGECSSSKEGK